MLQTHTEERDAGLTTAASPRFGQDVSRIPIHSSTAGALQTKLAVNQPGDEYEQEADRISEQVMRMPEPQARVQPARGSDGTGTQHQRRQQPQEHEHIQTKRVQATDTGQITAPPSVHEVLGSPGQPLDPATRAFMEPRFGRDFSYVRVHTGPTAEQSTQDVEALAYTVGHDIVFGTSRFAPGTQEGQRLLAHELTHVVQQTRALQRQPAPTSKSLAQQKAGNSIADATNLEHDMKDILLTWEGAAKDGVNNFALTALSERIDDLESGSWSSFLIALLGNTIWAAAAFVPLVVPGTVAAAKVGFAISMAGIGVAALPTKPPPKSKSAIPEIAEIAKTYISQVHMGLLPKLGDSAQKIIENNPGITKYRAQGEFVKANFKSGLYTINEDVGGLPTLNGNAIRHEYELVATAMLKHFISQIQPIGLIEMGTEGSTIEPERTRITQTGIAWARVGSAEYLVQMKVTNVLREGRPIRDSALEFVTFITPDVKDLALAKALEVQPRKIQTIESSSIRGFPSTIPADAVLK